LNPVIGQIVAALAGLGVVFLLLKRLGRRGGKLSKHPYQKQTALFSADERAFYRTLKDAVAGEYELFGKIRVIDIIVPKKGEALGSLGGERFDFVLCDKRTLAVVCAIQLREKARSAPEADPLQTACENLGLPFLRFQAGADYRAEEIREKLRKAVVKEPLRLQDAGGRKEPRISNIDDMQF